jgi:Copper type II ascorbate-dependent monooxygenase, C-terminal domain/Copper type II ascorbate-dependent monooxygenase, N-terminal domain/DOMON domain
VGHLAFQKIALDLGKKLRIIHKLPHYNIMKIHQNHIIFALGAALLQCFIQPLHAQDPSLFFPGSDNEVYVSWLANASYDKSAFLASTSSSEGEGVAVHWSIQDSEIHLAVVARATGWAAFGFAESGSMRGADIIMFTAETKTLVDSYVLDELVTPFPDECPSWELTNSVVDDGFIIFEAKRLLDTGDAQDRTIIDDSITAISPRRVIAAWGDESEPSYHGGNAARGSIRFFSTSAVTNEVELFARAMAAEAEGNFTVSAQDFIIPAEETTYQNFCFSRDDLIAQNVPLDEDLHTIGIEPVIDPRSKKYVHHFLLYASPQPWNSSLDCNTYRKIELAYTWGPGDLPFTLPSNVGSPLGIVGFQSYLLEVHYNNPDLDANVTDSSGIRAHYTSIKREIDLGVFQLGDPFVALYGGAVSPNGGLAQHTFDCESQCLDTYLSEPVTVIHEQLHMHMAGVSMVNYHIRDEKVIRQGQVDFWDFDQQGGLTVIQAPFQMNPGDAFQTVCNYDTSNETLWGLGSRDEMCIAYLYYYPRKLITNETSLTCGLGFEGECNATYALTPDFTNAAQLERQFGDAPASCPNVGTSNNKTAASTPTSSPPRNNSTTSGASVATLSNMVMLSLYGIITLWSL